MSNILVIDDEREIVDLIRKALEAAGHQVGVAYDGKHGLVQFNEKKYDLVILDICMPHVDGMKVCQIIREANQVPIIMISAKGQDRDKIEGLMTGADDYLVKPFSMEELVARVHSQMRRNHYINQVSKKVNRILCVKGLEIDESKRKVTLYHNEIKLTPTEFDILVLLVKHKGVVFSSEEIYRHIWKEKYFEGNNTVMSHMWRLREKIEVDPKNPSIIETVWGVGYKIDE